MPAEQGAPKLKKLPRPALLALYSLLRLRDSESELPGLEVDLMVETQGAVYPTSLWFDETVWVAVGPPTVIRFPADPGEAALAEKYEVVFEEIDQVWTPEVRGLVGLALSMLSEPERRVLRGTTFVRRKAPPAGRSRTSGWWTNGTAQENTRRIELYDKWLRPRSLFVGRVGAPTHPKVRTVLHELGHLIAFADHAVLTRWEDMAGQKFAPTKYGYESVHESFAEGFALHHADPEALRRISRVAFDFFEDELHIRPY